MMKAKHNAMGLLLEQAFGTEKERVSFTISADLYEAFADYAETKQVSMAKVFPYALDEFAAVRFTTPEQDAEFDAMVAETQAQQAIEDLPKLNGGGHWMN